MNLSSIFARFIVVLVAVALVMPGTAIASGQSSPADSPPSAEAPVSPETVSDRLLIGVQEGLTQEEVAAQLAAEGLVLRRYWPRFGIAEAIAPGPSARSASNMSVVQSASLNPAFRYVSPDQRVYAAETGGELLEPPMHEPQPNDANYNEQWAPGHIRAVEAWNISHGDPNVVIGVIDSGYDAGHPDLDRARIWKNQVEAAGVPGVDDDGNGLIDDISGWDWVEGDNDPNDPYGHGTHVLGVIAAATGNKIGIAGIGRNLTVAPLRILDEGGAGYLSDLVDAIDYAIDQGMPIVNMSLTIGSDSQAVRDAVTAASNAGVLIVAATGNQSDFVLWPAAYSNTVAVAATDWQDKRSYFSNFGPEVDIAAPGSNILSLYPGSSYEILSGTSMATPHVSALLGLLRSLRPDLSSQQVMDIMQASADDVNAGTNPGKDQFLGAGRINLYQALLDASTGLTLRVTPQTLDPLPAGDALELQVRVTAPQTSGASAADAPTQADALPVTGAVVYVQVLQVGGTATTPAPVSVQRRISKSNGIVNFTIAALDQVGSYLVRVQVGAAYVDLPLEVIESPGTIGLYVLSPKMTAGNSTTKYRVKLRDDEGDLLQGETPLKVETSLGTLDGGVTKLGAVAHNGIFTGTLYGGTVSGKGALTVSVGTRFAVRTIRVLPGAPSQVRIVERQNETYADDTVTHFSFDVTVQDQYGNAVVNGTAVRLSTSAGELTPVLLATQGGSAYFALEIPRSYTDPVRVVAEIPGLEVATELQVLGIPPFVWFPLVWVE